MSFLAEWDTKNRYIAAAFETEKAMRALIPKESKRYEPSKICVSLLPRNSRWAEKHHVAEWPLAQRPDVKNDIHFFPGAEAKTIIETLDIDDTVKIGDAIFTVIWTPAIVVPKPSVANSKQ